MRTNDLLQGGWLRGKRTYLVGVAMIAQAVMQYLSGDADLAHALNDLLEGIGLITLRSSISPPTRTDGG